MLIAQVKIRHYKEAAITIVTLADRLLVATGSEVNAGRVSAILHLEKNVGTKCNHTESLPVDLNGATGGLVNETIPLICGGYQRKFLSFDCFLLVNLMSFLSSCTF